MRNSAEVRLSFLKFSTLTGKAPTKGWHELYLLVSREFSLDQANVKYYRSYEINKNLGRFRNTLVLLKGERF